MNKILSILFCFISLNIYSATEQTIAIIKPNAVANKHIGDIISRYERSGLKIINMKMIKLTKEQASEFYKVHRSKSFYNFMTDFMSSGPIVVLLLEGDDAIARNRALIGATDPKKAAAGTLRADFGENIDYNAVHGSDSAETAKTEMDFFFHR